MEPIYLILYIAIITLVLTLVLPRFRQATPEQRRYLWLGVIIGGLALIIVTILAFGV